MHIYAIKELRMGPHKSFILVLDIYIGIRKLTLGGNIGFWATVGL